MYKKKINILYPQRWSHHYSGWNYIVDKLLYNFHTSNGILFFDWAEKKYRDNIKTNKKWGGILHNVVSYDNFIKDNNDTSKIKILSLEQLKDLNGWDTNSIGLFTLSDYTTKYISKYTNVKVETLYHPICEYNKKFSNNVSRVAFVGQWMRNIDAFSNLETPLDKFAMRSWFKCKKYNNINFINFIEKDNYEDFICDSIVFLNLYDVSACNVVLECIARNIPILINKLPANIEYLGEDYPFFYNSIEEANEKINNRFLIKETNMYLNDFNKEHLSIEYFLDSFNSSFFYKGLLQILC